MKAWVIWVLSGVILALILASAIFSDNPAMQRLPGMWRDTNESFDVSDDAACRRDPYSCNSSRSRGYDHVYPPYPRREPGGYGRGPAYGREPADRRDERGGYGAGSPDQGDRGSPGAYRDYSKGADRK